MVLRAKDTFLFLNTYLIFYNLKLFHDKTQPGGGGGGGGASRNKVKKISYTGANFG
jgi:hypothetical protein